MISALQSATPVLDVVGAAGIVAGTVKYSKFVFDGFRDPLRTNLVRLFVFVVSLIYVYGFLWLNGLLETGAQIAAAYSISLTVAGLALAGYHLLKGDFDGTLAPSSPASTTDTAPNEPVSTAPPIRVKRTSPDAATDRFGIPAEGEPATTEPESVPEWNLPPIVPPEPASPAASVPVARPSQEQGTTIDPPVHWAGDKPVSEMGKEDGS